MSEKMQDAKKTNGIRHLNLAKVKVRKAEEKDVDGIFNVASSTGKKRKDYMHGFLMDFYNSNPEGFKNKFRRDIALSDFFYVAEYSDKESRTIVGFTYGLSKENWLKRTPTWLDDCSFRPDFNMKNLDDFVVLEKIAVLDKYNRQGVGSMLSKRLIKDIKEKGIRDLFEEVIIAPVPNLPSVLFKKKRSFKLAATRFEEHNDQILTTLIYHKKIK